MAKRKNRYSKVKSERQEQINVFDYLENMALLMPHLEEEIKLFVHVPNELFPSHDRHEGANR